MVNETVTPTVTPTTASVNLPDFANDPRLHFSKETNTWRYEADDGTEKEWDTSKSIWVPVVRFTCLPEILTKAQSRAS
jgi:HIV Tat-specific factor 1